MAARLLMILLNVESTVDRALTVKTVTGAFPDTEVRRARATSFQPSRPGADMPVDFSWAPARDDQKRRAIIVLRRHSIA